MLETRRAADSFVTRETDRETRHAFSFGVHYDPANVGFGPLVCHNDDRLAPGGGYLDHPHADLEILTWVLDGVLVHTDNAGRREVAAGEVQLISAGSGIRHAETADPATPTRFVQTWVLPDEPGTSPWHAVRAAGLDDDALTPVVAGPGAGVEGAAGAIGTAGAVFWVARLAPGTSVDLPYAPRVHAFVARGRITPGVPAGALVAQLDHAAAAPAAPDQRDVLGTGDSLRAVDEPHRPVTALESSELLVWSFRH